MSYAAHETFHIREGWLYKGMAAISAAQTTIFHDEDGPERLGLGTNMVRALRFWMQATGLAEQIPQQEPHAYRLTSFGEWVWANDPYLEDDAVLWLIHYQLVRSEKHATTWYWFFNHFAPTTFDERACLEALRNWVVIREPRRKIAESSLKKDVGTLLRTYLINQQTRTPEDLLECPLARLGILSQFKEGSQTLYRLERLEPVRLHPLMFLYILIKQQREIHDGALQVNRNQVLSEPNHVGRIFNLTTTTLTNLLATLNREYPQWKITSTLAGGLNDLSLPPIGPDQVLEQYAIEKRQIREIVR